MKFTVVITEVREEIIVAPSAEDALDRAQTMYEEIHKNLPDSITFEIAEG